jgi:uncharacterized protein (UPF0332 family)
MNGNAYNWDEFLTFAGHLTDCITGETSARTAIGRAYYAAYWKARMFLADNGVVIPRRNMHKFVWMCFYDSYDANGRSIRGLGVHLQGLRNIADYDANARVSTAEAVAAVTLAKQLLHAFAYISPLAKQAALNTASYLVNEPEYRGRDADVE